jgi:hypothetical protein
VRIEHFLVIDETGMKDLLKRIEESVVSRLALWRNELEICRKNKRELNILNKNKNKTNRNFVVVVSENPILVKS